MVLVPFPESANAEAGDALAQRVLDAFPSGTYALSALLRLLDIQASTAIPTAAVECRLQPRLLINPEFVARHADTPEKLLMLVMHELHHVLLGHTTLFPRNTAAQNFVFDAVINGVICRMFPDAQYTAFLSDYYDSARFPHCLLRPPPGWPKRGTTAPGITQLPAPQRARVAEVHKALYSEAGASYQEVFEVLPRLLDEQGLADVALLGGHQSEGLPEGQLQSHAPVLFDMVRDLVEQWPQPPDPIRGRSLASVLQTTTVNANAVPGNRRLLRQLMLKLAGLRDSGGVRQTRTVRLEAPSPLPNLGRRAMVLHALGFDPLLHQGVSSWQRCVPASQRVHVYLDVSGSMDGIKDALYGAVLACQAWVHPVVHLFSDKVADISLAQLRQGVCQSTGGTSIECVAEHIQAQRVRRALLITDGWVGQPRGEHLQTLTNTRLAVAYLGRSTNTKDLQSVARYTATLSTGV